ncbi:hypothetical protein AMS68_006167 [Peltaster fructicola]|uniref:Trimethylguanosine synthase n=1 Tax=Peltaster fructicola TaxID=286661 RepID=A0A6H0Y1Y3_9PEZI|nr:hypothetical protein AMS68_006167 [Peltaster fructicola]
MGSTEEPLPNGIHHYTEVEEVPSQILKYWHRRHEIFSKYDEGVWMTDDVWFGVTPEPIAQQIATEVARAPPSKTIIIDAFGGAGGNVIHFALSGRWSRIFLVEKDATVLQCAKRNAEIYGVRKKIWFIHGDSFEVLQEQLKGISKDAVIFGSPPWGGPSYTSHNVFDLSVMQPYSLMDLHSAFSKASDHYVLYLPRTSDLRQIAELAQKDKKLDVIHYCMHGHSNALCVYFGSFAEP